MLFYNLTFSHISPKSLLVVLYIFRFLSPQHVQIITTFFRRLCAYSTLSYAFSTIYRYFHFVSPSFLCFYVKFQQILLVMFRCPPPLLGRNAENLSKITIKSGYCCESAVQCNVTYGGICLSQLFARCPDPNPVDIFHRRHPHGFLKNTAQMCLTDVAHIRKFFNPDALVEIFPDIIERRKNQGNAGIIQNGILFLRLIFSFHLAICIRSARVSPFTSSR